MTRKEIRSKLMMKKAIKMGVAIDSDEMLAYIFKNYILIPRKSKRRGVIK